MIFCLFKFLLSTILFVVATAGCTTELNTVRVDGPTYSVPALTSIQNENTPLSVDQLNEFSHETSALEAGRGGFKPLDTHLKLCSGHYSKAVSIDHLPHPFFVVGDDDASYQWIATYKPILQKINAIGLCIKAKDLAGLNRLHQASGLPINPAQGDEVATLFKISCYPVLITAHRIEH